MSQYSNIEARGRIKKHTYKTSHHMKRYTLFRRPSEQLKDSSSSFLPSEGTINRKQTCLVNIC